MNLIESMRGKRTYIVALITILVVGLKAAGYLTEADYEVLVGALTGLGLVTLRSAIAPVS